MRNILYAALMLLPVLSFSACSSSDKDDKKKDDSGTTGKIELTPSSIDITHEAQEFTFVVTTNVDYELSIDEAYSEWLYVVDEGSRATNSKYESYVVTLAATENEGSENRCGEVYVIFNTSPISSLTLSVTQYWAGEDDEVVYVDLDSTSTSISSMTTSEWELGPVYITVLGTLSYELSMKKTGYSQGTVKISEDDVAEVLGITTEDLESRVSIGQIDCVPLDADGSEGATGTTNGAYGAWYGTSGVVTWGTDAICYLEGSSMWSYDYGAYEGNSKTSCTMRLQYKDTLERIGCNAEFVVTLK